MPSYVIADYNYDPLTRILKVRYLSGSLYHYLDVPEEVYIAMKAAFSKGSFLNNHVKKNYRYEKIKSE